MDEVQAELTKSWMEKAASDLKSAQLLASPTDGPLDAAIYHCQQAAEKALKAYLLCKDVPFEKTHDIVRLVRQAEELDRRFVQFVESGRLLTPLAWEFRYPSEAPAGNPSREQFRGAFQHAQAIYDFVLSLLPNESHPA
jgi:HEPN domain-containing protein